MFVTEQLNVWLTSTKISRSNYNHFSVLILHIQHFLNLKRDLRVYVYLVTSFLNLI